MKKKGDKENKILQALSQVFGAIKYRISNVNVSEKELRARKRSLYNENFITCQLQSQLEEVLEEFDNFERPVVYIRVVIDPMAIPFLSKIQNSLDCSIIQCATPGEYILKRESVYL